MRINKSNVTLLVILMVFMVVGIVRGIILSRKKPESALGASRIKGNPNAKIKIIEYVHYGCPACAVGSAVLQSFLKQYPDKIFVEMRYFPFGEIPAAQYAECAAQQGKFWEYHDLLMGQQKDWLRLSDPVPVFKTMAQSTGLDMNRLDRCVASEQTSKTVAAVKSSGESLGVKSTPTYFINGQMLVGAGTIEAKLKELLGGS